MAVEKKPVKIMETVLRDAHQSLIATRMTTEQMLPIIDKMDKVGYHEYPGISSVRRRRSRVFRTEIHCKRNRHHPYF